MKTAIISVMAVMTVLASAAETQSLAGSWRLNGFGARGQKIDIECKVPGDVHSALYKAGMMRDPFKGSNEIKTQWVGRHEWSIARDFEVDAAILAKKEIVLKLEDVDCFATILVNGNAVGKTGNRFRRYEFNVKPLLKAGTNRIEGCFESAEAVSDELAKGYEFYHTMDNSFQAMNLAVIRKPACHGGWDWGLSQMTVGFCGKVELVADDKPWVDYIYSEQKFSDDLKHCTLTVTAEMCDGSKQVKVFEIENPPLWWPNGMGKREFYEFEIAGEKRRIGLRKLEVRRPQGGIVFAVNNREFFAKGANWIPCDAFDARQTPEKYRDLLQSAADANMNMIRLWGGGQFEKDAFYDICDELGLLIWHDFMHACAVYPANDEFLDELRAEMSHQIRRLRDHASIALWCGDNECLGPATWWNRGDPPRQAYYNKVWHRRSEVQTEIVAKYDPTRFFWPSSPCGGPDDLGDGHMVPGKGDAHSWGVWHGNKPFEAYGDVKPRFCSEFGFQSFPAPEVCETFAKDWAERGQDFEWHQKNNGGNRRIRATMARYFRMPKDVVSEILLSQFQQGLAIKTAVTTWRAEKPRCMGTLIWQLDDNWPVASWSTIDYGGKWKPLHYMAKRFYKPLLVTAGTNGVVSVVNDSAETVTDDVIAEYLTYDGKLLKTVRFPVTVTPERAVEAGKLEPGDGFVRLRFRDDVNDWHSRFFKDAPVAKAKVAMKTDGFKVTLTTDKPAFFVWVNAKGVRGEFDDNAFTLIPGEEKTIVFKPKDAKVTADAFAKALSVASLADTY